MFIKTTRKRKLFQRVPNFYYIKMVAFYFHHFTDRCSRQVPGPPA